MARVGFQRGIVVGLLVASVGALAFYPVATTGSYGAFLTALFVLAAGITILQVSANPYVSILGSANTASSRLTMTQAFNSLGATVAPILGGWLILSVAADTLMPAAEQTKVQATAVQTPYLILAGTLILMAVIFSLLKLPKPAMQTAAVSPTEQVDGGSAWQYRHLVLGALAIFVYVGAEVGIGSLIINFAAQGDIAGLTEHQAAKYVTYFWGGAMIGRFIGALIMQKLPASVVLTFNGVVAMVLLLVAIFASGMTALWAITLVGLCNSIMFPTIFTLALNGLGKHTSQGSGILCLAIVGGAILPVVQGLWQTV